MFLKLLAEVCYLRKKYSNIRVTLRLTLSIVISNIQNDGVKNGFVNQVEV